MRQVFISYSSKEAAQANDIVRVLEEKGIECWIAPRNIRVGSNYTKDIPSAIRECPSFLLVLSKEAQESRWVNKELSRAINQDKLILPLMIEEFAVSEGFEFLLEDVQIRPYYQEKTQTMREVVEEIQRLMPREKSADVHTAPDNGASDRHSQVEFLAQLREAKKDLNNYFKPGDIVNHLQFGKGTVTAVIKSGDNMMINIRFESSGEKRFHSSSAYLYLAKDSV